MNSQLEECIGRFVQDVRLFSSYEAVHFELGIGSNEFSVNVTYRTPAELERDGISMRNLNGQWIRAADKKESPKTIVQQTNYATGRAENAVVPAA
jgi:hypothetical protein